MKLARVATMRAATLAAPGRLTVDEIAVPAPRPGEVRVRLEGSGVCASNLPVWAGQPWFSYPLAPGAPGHEGWGRVDALGDGVDGIAVGERVALLSGHAYAEFDVGPAASIVRLPSELDDRPFPGEPLGCAVNVLRRSDVRPDHTVAIVGIGFLGALLTRLAADAGASVIAIGRRPFALEVARAMGAAEAVALDDHRRVVERVKEITRGALCERVVEATGKQGPLELAAELCRERGRLVIAGYHQDGARHVDMQLWNWRGLDVINAHERDPAVYVDGMRAAIELVASGRLDPTPLYTHVYPLDRLDEALDATRDRPDGFLKALVAV